MFVLRFKDGTTKRWYNRDERRWEDRDVGGRYIRHTRSNTESWFTEDLERAKVYNTEAGAKCNEWAYTCDIVEVKVTLA